MFFLADKESWGSSRIDPARQLSPHYCNINERAAIHIFPITPIMTLVEHHGFEEWWHHTRSQEDADTHVDERSLNGTVRAKRVGL